MTGPDGRRRVVIMGAAGRDFHNFNVLYRGDPRTRVVAFTAAQIPGIGGRSYPPSLAGPLYPDGIPVLDEAELEDICRREGVDQVDFAYSDVTHETVMHAASRALATGADFFLAGPGRTMLSSPRPVVSVTAIRTGCGKSQTARHICGLLRGRGLRVAAIRHPMPYGDPARQRLQRFASRADLDAAGCTNEEREEYEPHIDMGGVVFAGVDYGAILAAAAMESDIIVWDGGNNDFSFLRPDLDIVMADALRPGQAAHYHPGETVLRRAEIIVLNKVDAAEPGMADAVADELAAVNPRATLVRAASPVVLDDPAAVQGRRVIVIEDGPTITHGGQAWGAGLVAARAAGAREIVDPRAFAAGSVRELYARWPHIGPVLPDVGYDEAQRRDLGDTLAACDAEAIIVATPIDLSGILPTDRPAVRARYGYADAGEPTLGALLAEFLDRRGLAPAAPGG